MKNLKKLIIFVLALSLLLSSFTISNYADEINNRDNTSSNNDIGPYNDTPKQDGNSD